MKFFLYIITFSLVLSSCSSDDNANSEQIQKPSISSISTDLAKIGDTITINGNNFDPNGNYVIKFNNINGIIVEVKINSIKVKIPKGAISGKITLNFKDQNIDVGTLEIINENNFIYAIKSDYVSSSETTKFIKINPKNGNKIELLDLQTTDNIKSLSINNSTNQIFGVTRLGDGNSDLEIYTINFKENTFSSTNLNHDPEIEYVLVPKNNGTIYAIKQSGDSSSPFTSKLITINPSNGEEINILDLQTTHNFNSLVFNNQTNQIFGATYIGDGNLKSEIYTIDLNNNNFTFRPLNDQFSYELAITDNGTLYTIKQTFGVSEPTKLYTLNPSNGNETFILDLETNESFNNLIVKENKLIGATDIDYPNINSEIYTIDIQNNSFSFENLNSDPNIDFELIGSY